MPPEPAGPARVYVVGHHELPAWVVDALISLHHGGHDVRKPVTALQCITAVARSARDLGQLAASLAMYGWQVVRIARHLAGLAQSACNLFSFLCIHVYILSNKIPYYPTGVHKSSGLLLVAWRLRLGACRLRLDSRIFFCCSQQLLTVPRMSGAGPQQLVLRVKDTLHHFKVLLSGRDHKAGVTDDMAPLTPISCELVLTWFHVPVAHL